MILCAEREDVRLQNPAGLNHTSDVRLIHAKERINRGSKLGIIIDESSLIGSGSVFT
jgi:hypothetical protein